MVEDNLQMPRMKHTAQLYRQVCSGFCSSSVFLKRHFDVQDLWHDRLNCPASMEVNCALCLHFVLVEILFVVSHCTTAQHNVTFEAVKLQNCCA